MTSLEDPGYTLICVTCDYTLEFVEETDYGYVYGCPECLAFVAVFETPLPFDEEDEEYDDEEVSTADLDMQDYHGLDGPIYLN